MKRQFDSPGKRIAALSDARVDALGHTVSAVGWSSNQQQELRFKILVKHLSISKGDNLLDLGCGFADLYSYLTTTRFKPTDLCYTGVELSQAMFEYVKNKYPEITVYNKDFWSNDISGKRDFDFIICSGALNYADGNSNASTLENFLQLYWPLARKAIAINLITSDVDYINAELKYFDPTDCLTLIRKYTKRYILDSNYPLWEFTLILIKE